MGVVAFIFLPCVHGQVVLYPAPAEEVLSTEFQVWVNGQEVDVYNKEDVTAAATISDKGVFGNGGGLYSFAYFDLAGSATVRVRSTQNLRNAVIRPASEQIAYTTRGNYEIEFTIDGPVKLSIEGPDPKAGLLLFANPLETDPVTGPAPDVVYYGPGIHQPDEIYLTTNQTLYVAGGAILKTAINVRGTNVTIRGRGIIDSSEYEWPTKPINQRGLITFENSHGVYMSDVIVRASSCWTIVPMHSSLVRIDNVKLCNSRVQNDDGIDVCNSQDVVVSNCFFRTDDDCIALKGWSREAGENNNIEDVLVQNSLFWCDRARIFLLGHESEADHMRNITFLDNEILHYAMTPFLIEPAEQMLISKIVFGNFRVHSEGQSELLRLKPVELPQYSIPGYGYVDQVHFKDVEVTGTAGACQMQLYGHYDTISNKSYQVGNVYFENVSLFGEVQTYGSSYLATNALVGQVVFGQGPATSAAFPSPANGSTNVAAGIQLEWTPGWPAGALAVSNAVYFGTSPTPAFQGIQSGTSHDPGPLAEDTAYYWRVDTVFEGGTVTGEVWSFVASPPPPLELANGEMNHDGSTIAGWRNEVTMGWELKSDGSNDFATVVGDGSSNGGNSYGVSDGMIITAGDAGKLATLSYDLWSTLPDVDIRGRLLVGTNAVLDVTTPKAEIGPVATNIIAGSYIFQPGDVGRMLSIRFDGENADLNWHQTNVDNVVLSLVPANAINATINAMGGGTGIVVSWSGQAGVNYTVQTNANLMIADNWADWLTGIPGGNDTVSVTNTTDASQLFFRISID